MCISKMKLLYIYGYMTMKKIKVYNLFIDSDKGITA